MGRSMCCEKVGLKKGPWTPEEDKKLLAYIEQHGHGSWRALPAKAGLQRCGKSCRLRWTNYLRPDIKRGKFSLQEEQTIIQLHALLGNRWSAIATHLPKRTDNEIKNYWNTHLKKRLTKMGIDPVTHKPKSDALGSGQWKGTANLSHMAQWESARLEAEARLVRESKMVSNNPFQPQLGSSTTSAQLLNKAAAALPPPPCLDVLKAWQGTWAKSIKDISISSGGGFFAAAGSLESPTSTLNFSENALPIVTIASFSDNPLSALEYVNNTNSCLEKSNNFPEKMEMNSMQFQDDQMAYTIDSVWTHAGTEHSLLPNFMEGITADILLENSGDDHNSSNFSGNSDNAGGCCGGGDFEENKNYWNSILNLVNSTATGLPPVMM